MASLRKLVHAWVLVIAVGVLAAAPTNAAQNDLIDASGAGDLIRVKTLLAANADVNAKMADGTTALMTASYMGRLDVVQTLLAAHADVNAKATDGTTALMDASQKGHQKVAELLRRHGGH